METLTLHATILLVHAMLLSYRYRNGDPHVTCCYPICTVMETLTLHAAILWVHAVMETLTLHAAILSV